MKIGLALSGGGIRGIAHAGVIKALEEHGIRPNIIGGTSAGGIIASLYALGYSPYYIYILFKRYAKDIVEINSSPIVSGITGFMLNKKIVISGLKTGENIEKTFDELAIRKRVRNIGDIKNIPLVIPTVDISDGREYIFTNNPINNDNKYISNISLGKAVRASSSFPGVFSPCNYKSHLFLDGGVLDNVPVKEVKKQGADKVIAVNFKADDVDENSNIMDIAMRTLDIMGNKISKDSLESSDYILTIKTDKTGLLDIEKLDSCYKFGYRQTCKEINEIRKIF